MNLSSERGCPHPRVYAVDRGPRGCGHPRSYLWVVHGPDARPILEVEAVHEPFIRKRQRAAALQDASEAHVLPGFREVLDCASPLALWLPLQKGVHGTDARPILEVEALRELARQGEQSAARPRLQRRSPALHRAART